MDIANKRVTVIGLSESGFSAAKLLKRVGASARISESRDDDAIRAKLEALGEVESEMGAHSKGFIEKSDLVVTSPGVAFDAEPLKWARDAGIPVISELELGYRFCRSPIVAVTGTNGKSTTVSMIHHMLGVNGMRSHLLGNIGRPICEEVLDISPGSVVSLEVSSFQLETIERFRPKISVLLNVTQDHLDRYKNMKKYREAKSRIFENQGSGDYAILDHDDPAVRRMADGVKAECFYFSVKEKVRGSYLSNQRIFIDTGSGPVDVCGGSETGLRGIHNIQNALAAFLVLKLNIRNADMLDAIRSFKALPHRFELVYEIDGVKYINDSKSTTVDSTMKALRDFPEQSVILIAGGRDKGSDYSPIIELAKKIKYAVLIGETRSKIRSALNGQDVRIHECGTLQEAVTFSGKAAQSGDAVILSPMCSSFDMFKNYKERGDEFKASVFRRALS
ncbi:MAG: UDP-N-acetylmuramoyl-L-alanine--D-glutamate ligase [Candidatus Omnitrophica bacterium]|nr:UDP-N-acetylmuramoyl-L-alanine--D-glutamate ligase [Candidatus Omnitrophota bacterium]